MRDDSPFLGPRPLDNNTPIHGRGRELRELSNLLISRRIVLLYSPSGAGKSSLIDAKGGLLDNVGRGKPDPLLEVRPITRVHTQPPAGTTVNRFAWSVTNGLGIAPAATLTAAIGPTIQKPTLLVFDQFEEILRTDPAGATNKRAFFEQLGELLLDPRIWALFALREDYLAPLDPYRVLLPTRLETRYRLDLLAREDAAEVIQQTATAANVPFSADALSKLLDDLTLTEVQQPDFSFAPGTGGFVEPLHLQVVCAEMWRNLAPDAARVEAEDVRKFGDVATVLGQLYDRVVEDIAGHHQYELRTWIATQLISAVRTRAQVLMGKDETAGLPNAQIDQLVDRYLVRREPRLGATWLELAHDRLVEPVLKANGDWFAQLGDWERRVRNWTAEKNEDLRASYLVTGRRLREAAAWFQAHSDSVVSGQSVPYLAACRKLQNRLNARRAAVVAMAALLVIACAALVLAQWREAGVKRANTALGKSNLALTEQIRGLQQQSTDLTSEVAALREAKARLTKEIAGLAAQSRQIVSRLRTLHSESDALITQAHAAIYRQTKFLQGNASALRQNGAMLDGLKTAIGGNTKDIDDLNAANVQNRALMTRIIELGIKLPKIPPQTILLSPMPMVLAATQIPLPPPYVPPPDEYLRELLRRNAELLAEALRLSQSDQSLRAEAAALRRQNEALAALKADLREQIARTEGEERLLSSLNGLRREEIAEFQSESANLESQKTDLSNIEGSITFAQSLLRGQSLHVVQLRQQVDWINQALAKAVHEAEAQRRVDPKPTEK